MQVTFINLVNRARTAPPAPDEMVRPMPENFMDPKILLDVVDYMSSKVSTEELPDGILDLTPVTNPDGYRSQGLFSKEKAEESLQALEREPASSRETPSDFTDRAYSGKAIAMLDWSPR
jgi:hypothetical protein